MPEWIKCSEQLPDDGELVLIYGPNIGFYIARFFADSDDPQPWYVEDRAHNLMRENVTHWMRLEAPE